MPGLRRIAAAGVTTTEPPGSTRSGHPPVLVDNVVGAGEDRWRDRQPQRLGGLEIDDQLEPSQLLDWQIGRLGAVEDLSGVNAQLARVISAARSIAYQAAGRGEIAPNIDRRNSVARRHCHELL